MQETTGSPNARFAIGYDAKKMLHQADLLAINHLLIAGTTGVGKTVFMDTIMLSLIQNNTPEQIRLILCDTKQIQMQQYRDINHLIVPICTTTPYIAAAFMAVLAEATRRVELFADSGTKSIIQYNEILAQQSNTCLPRLIIVIDDLSVLLRERPDTADIIKKIISLGRTVGIHLIAITQNPAARDTKDITALFVTKAIFQTVSPADRRLLTGSTMQFDLDEAGDYIFMSGATKIKCHVIPPNEDEMNRIIFNHSGACQYSKIFTDEIEKNIPHDSDESNYDTSSSDDALDPMFDLAVECIVEAGQASTSLLQRRLKLGYTRAAHIMDQMEEAGIIGPYIGAAPRSVLITGSQWNEAISDNVTRIANQSSHGKDSTGVSGTTAIPSSSVFDSEKAYDAFKRTKEPSSDGIITQDIYDSERKKPPVQLTSSAKAAAARRACNVQIQRKKDRPSGESRTIAVIDGTKRTDIDLDTVCRISLAEGKHSIYFKRAAVKSRVFDINVTTSNEIHVAFNPHIFSIDVDVTEK